nr:tetratricopeptide repeat protein [Anaerolineae bacterium]
MWELAPEEWVAYPPERLIGRKSQQEAIRQAVQEGIRLVYIEGGAGIGKTRLLAEVESIVGNLPEPPVVLGVVDFYDTAKHGSLALEEALAEEMRKRDGEDAVEAFFALLERYRTEEASADEVHAAFVDACKAWIGERWAVLRFDTAEFLEYGQEDQEVLEECEVLGEEVPAVQWLRKHLPRLKRVTALVAARPTRILQRQLEEAYPSHLWRFVPLDTLSLDETREYFRASPFGQEIDEEMVERMWLLTDGRPILLSLAIDWLARGIRVDEVYEADIGELRRLKKERDEEWERLRERFEWALVEKVRLLNSPIDAAVYYAARARKGFTPSMLRKMLAELSPRRFDLSAEEGDKLMEELAKLSFVKHPYGAREGWYFLHDEMYELLDLVWKQDYPGYTHQAETAGLLAEKIYGEEMGSGLIAEAAGRVRDARTHGELLEARRHFQVLRTEQLFYQLEADPVRGYRLYNRLDAQAISQWQHEWDDMLRIEALRFMRTLPERARSGGLVKGFDPETGEPMIADSVNRDCRAHWVQRYAARKEYEKADRIARKLLNLHPDWGGLWRARVLVGQGMALARREVPEADGILQEALDILEGPGLEGDQWLIRHDTGMAYLFRGLYARSRWDWALAVEMGEKARKVFEENDESVEMARALTNCAYVLTQRGRYIDGVQAARRAEGIRRELGDGVGTALSLNTLAFAEDRAGTYASAQTHAREALNLLRRIQQMGRPGLVREIAMVHLNLGMIHRHVVERSGILSGERAESVWKQARMHLEEARKYEGSLEPYYRYELYNQLGLLYDRWANWIAERAPQERARYHDFMKEADAFHKRADEFAEQSTSRVAQADNLEDWAWVFHLRRAYKDSMKDPEETAILEQEVLQRLRKAEELVREAADSDREGLQEQYVAGSIHHQWGRFIHKFKVDLEDELRHYALSIAYYDRYSSEPVERRDRVLGHLQDTLAGLPPAQARRLATVMLHAVEERRLPAEELRRRLEDMVAGITLEERYG